MASNSIFRSAIKPAFKDFVAIIPLSIPCYTFSNAWILSLTFLLASLLSYIITKLFCLFLEKKFLVLLLGIATVTSVTILSLLLQIVLPNAWHTLEFYIYIMTVPLVSLALIPKKSDDQDEPRQFELNFRDQIIKIGAIILVLLLQGLVREFLGQASITFIDEINTYIGISFDCLYPVSFKVLSWPAGAFFILALGKILINAFSSREKVK